MEEQKGCIKCGSTQATSKNVSMAGSGLSKMFDIEHNNFVAVSCDQCGYTEFYTNRNNRGNDLLDLFFS